MSREELLELIYSKSSEWESLEKSDFIKDIMQHIPSEKLELIAEQQGMI